MEEKQKVGYSLTKKILTQFNELSKKMGFNKSALVEILIKQWIVENEDKQRVNKKMSES